ncbi:hypothetical protein B5C26_15475 [Photorhabdus luminescens]|nr:hypothetical protein B5C26_15475 [Photorhabdus luminescens]
MKAACQYKLLSPFVGVNIILTMKSQRWFKLSHKYNMPSGIFNKIKTIMENIFKTEIQMKL